MILPKFSPRRRVSWSKAGVAFAVTLLATGSLAYGQSYTTNFNTASDGTVAFQAATLSGQGVTPWDTNDGYKGTSSAGGDAGQSDYVGPINYGAGGVPSPFAGNQGALGGLFRSSGNLPTSTTVYLEHGYNPGTAANYTFTTDFDIAYPAAGTAGANFTRDSFGFMFGSGLETGTPTRLFSLNFTPDLSGAGNSANQMVLSYTDYAGGNTMPVTPTLGGLARTVAYNGVYHLVLSVNVQTNTLSATFTGTNSFTFSGSLTAGQAASVREFAATWVLTSTTGNATTGYTNSGTNSLIMDNLSIVPEPSTWAVLGAGMLGLAVFARRRVRA